MDVIQGRGPSPSLVLRLVWRLPDTSLSAALAAGGREHFGWGQDRYLNAAIYDALNANTRATGQWKNKPPNIPEYPKPKRKGRGPDGKKKPVTVADIYARFARR